MSLRLGAPEECTGGQASYGRMPAASGVVRRSPAGPGHADILNIKDRIGTRKLIPKCLLDGPLMTSQIIRRRRGRDT